jgi:hypothetical protein
MRRPCGRGPRRTAPSLAKALGLSCAAGAAALWLGCARAPALAFGDAGDPLIVQHAALYPEAIEYDSARDRFLLGSFREGALYAVDPAGRTSLLVGDPRLCSVLGIAVDAARGRVWAVNSDLGASAKPSAAGPKRVAGAGIYDLATGEAIAYADLAPLAEGPHLANGIALDAEGNAFITDSFAPVIYKVTKDGEASVFLQDPRFAGAGVNLNGLIVHPDGYLIAVKKNDGALFKIPLDRPSAFTRVAVARDFVGGDGLTLVGKGSLVVIANRTPAYAADAAYALTSRDGWATAEVASVRELGDVYPTNAVLRKGTLHLVQSRLDRLIAAPPEEKARLQERAAIRPIGRVPGG